MDTAIVIAIISGGFALLASIPGLLALKAQKRKINSESSKAEADAAQVVQNMAINLIEPYRKRVDELEGEMNTRIGNLETALAETFDCLMEVSECAHALYDQIKKQGGDPICEPPSKDILIQKRNSVGIKKKRKTDNTL